MLSWTLKSKVKSLLPAALRTTQTCRYLVYSEVDFEVFRPAGATRCTDGVKFGMEEGTEDPLLHAKFHPHRFNDKGVGPPKLKFLLRFDWNLEYKCPAGAYPLRDFDKICIVCTSFQDALMIKILLDLLKGLWSYGGFKLRGSGCPKFSAPPSPIRQGDHHVRHWPTFLVVSKLNYVHISTFPLFLCSFVLLYPLFCWNIVLKWILSTW